MEKTLTARLRFAVLAAVFILLNLSGGRPAHADSLSDLTKTVGGFLPAEQYVPVEVRQLRHAKVLWVNWELLREYGVTPPPAGLTPEFESRLVRAFAWAVPATTDAADTFTDDTRTLYADRYGGAGRGANIGSGRAASFLGRKPLQSKGSGQTSLVRATTEDHSNGRMSLEEAMREAIWGEINARQLPFGSNRVLLVLDRGTQSPYSGGQLERDAIVIREDPVRPAHFMMLDEVALPLEKTRGAFAKALRVTERRLKSADGFRAAIRPYIRKVAAQYARAFVGLKTYHGAASPSNIEVSGRFLDYGTQTRQPGHGKIKIVNTMSAAGDNLSARHLQIYEFLDEASRLLGVGLSAFDLVALNKEFDTAYKQRERVEFLALVGWPPPIAERLATTADGKKLADVLLTLATADTKPYVGKYVVDERANAPAFPFGSFVDELLSPVSRQRLIGNDNAKVREAVQLFSSLQRRAVAQAQAQGVSETALNTYMRLSSQLKNKDIPELYRWNLMAADRLQIERYLSTQDPRTIGSFIEERIEGGLTYVNSAAPWELIVSEKDLPYGRQRVVFDAVTERFRSDVAGAEAEVPAPSQSATSAPRGRRAIAPSCSSVFRVGA